MIVSIILPAFNAEHFIDRCISSIYNNCPSLDDFEVIAINDGSIDKTLFILNEYRKNYQNLTVINKENGGVSSARNVGIEHAKGKYVLFIDADDELVEGAFVQLCYYLEQHDFIDMLMTCQLRNDGNKEWLATSCCLDENHSYNGVEAFRKKYIRRNAGGGVCRTAFLHDHDIRFPEGIKNEEDTIFFVLVQIFAQTIVFFNLNLYRIYEVHGSASRIDFKSKADNLIVTAHSVSLIKRDLNVDIERRAIFDFLSYKILRDLCSNFAASKELHYRQLRDSIDIRQFLPLDFKHIYIERAKIFLMNFNFPMFYLFSWIKQRISRI